MLAASSGGREPGPVLESPADASGGTCPGEAAVTGEEGQETHQEGSLWVHTVSGLSVQLEVH